MDAARLFVLSDSPPERDVQWTESGVEGSWRFVNRVWAEVDAAPRRCGRSGARPDRPLRRATHKLIKAVGEALEGFRFNSAIAQFYAFLNLLRRDREAGAAGAGAQARGEAVRALTVLITPFTPHLAESAWERLGGEGIVADAPWPRL